MANKAKKRFMDLQVKVSSPIGMQLVSSVDRAVEIAVNHVREILELSDADPRLWNAVVFESKYNNSWIVYADRKDGEVKVIGPFVLGNSTTIHV